MANELWPIETGKSPFDKVFQEVGKARLPNVVLVDDLDALHALIRPFVPTPVDYDKAMREAIRSGALDLSEVDRRYGRESWERTPKVFLPLPDGVDDRVAFRVQGKKLLPPEKELGK